MFISKKTTKPQLSRTLKAKKILTAAVCAAIMVTVCSVTAFAEAGGAQVPAFFTDALGALQTVVLLIGGGIGVWGIIGLLEGYSNDNPGSKAQGIKQLMAGIGIVLVSFLIPQLAQLWG